MNNPNADDSEWMAITERVLEDMDSETSRFVTPISRVIEHDYGELEGSGSYIEIAGIRYLITNEHVAARLQTHSLAHQFSGSSNVYRTREPFVANPYPYDVGLRRISDQHWHDSAHEADVIAFNRIAPLHSPVDGELFFIAGYAGERSKFSYGQLNSERIAYLMQSNEFPSNHGDSNMHFAISYRPDLARSTKAHGQGLPDPHGLSGTLVWNTRYVELSQNNQKWTPDQALVTGIVWGWPSGDGCLLATKAEHFHLLEIAQAIQQAEAV